MIRINRDFSLDQFEAALDAVASGNSVLKLPHSIKANAAGTETSLVQLVITWARIAADRSVLRLYSEADDVDGQRALAETVFGLVALNLAQAVEDRSGERLDRFALLTLARDYVIAMAEKPILALRSFAKTSTPFVCIDNARNYRRPARLYVPGTDRVRDRSDFASLVRSCASQLPLNRRKALERILDPAASLLFEAFHNTHDHAQTDHRGDVLRRSVRGFTISFRYVRLDGLEDTGGSSTPLKAYYRDWRPDFSDAIYAQFLELGIFDSGPGLARRWLSDDKALAQRIPQGNDMEAEYAAVVACLAKGATTKSGQTSGNGLFRIMQAVKHSGGFIRIRTGNLSLLKAFDESGAPIVPDDLQLVDLMSGTRGLQPRAWTEGTAMSVLLPMNRAMSA